MKKSILICTASIFMAAVVFTSCQSSSEKVEDATIDLLEAERDLDKAAQEYLTDLENFRKEAAKKIAVNEKSIADFKARIELEKKEVSSDYRKKINELEEKNTDMKKTMDDYKAEGKESWEKFKSEFNKDMDKLVKALQELAVKDVKLGYSLNRDMCG
jgi:hypothetical protein